MPISAQAPRRPPRHIDGLAVALIAGLISLAGNTLLTYCLSHQLNVPPLASSVTAIALCSPINFLVADCWVYHEPQLRGDVVG